MRTDDNNNPTAFTTAIARLAGLTEGVDYEQGSSFTADNVAYYTAKLLGDPIDITIRVIDAIGFFTKYNMQRWTYIGIPKFLWDSLDKPTKTKVIGYMYHQEGGTAMQGLFI